MPNFVPLQLDKDTGNIHAQPLSGGGGGVPFGTGYFHDQLLADVLWVIQHNENNEQLLVQVFDDNDKFILPDEIEIIDINTVHVSFGAAMTGTARIMFFN